MRARRVELARRRGGGGAVYLGPGEQLWLDVWIPRQDPLWVADVSVAAEWVGAWWTAALASAGVGQQGVEVHTGRSVPGPSGDLVCFAGRGPGEVFSDGRKVVGLSQWRAGREPCSPPAPTSAGTPSHFWRCSTLEPDERRGLVAGLVSAAVGLAELDPGAVGLAHLQGELLRTLPGFTVTGPPGA